MTTSQFWHFTCDDGAKQIGEMGLLRPHFHPLVGASLVWLTGDREISRDGAGLTSVTLSCDRMAHCYRVVDDEAHLKVRPWLGSPEQARTAPHVQADLHRYSDPAKWFISRKPVLVEVIPDDR